MAEPPTNAHRRSVLPAPVVAVIGSIAILAIAGGLWLAFGAESLGGGAAAELAAARKAYEAGDYAAAESQLTEIVEDDADDLEARRTLALALSAQGKNDEAIEQYAAVVESDPENHESLAAMAATEQLLGKASEAIEHLESAIAVKPDPSYYRALAPIYASVGKWTECIDAWTKYLELTELDPVDEGQVHAAMAAAYDGMREYDKAKAELEQAISLDPGNETYKSRLGGYAN